MISGEQGNPIDWYPPMKFKISSKDLFRKSAIMVEVSENSLMKVRKRGRQALPADYWDFIPKDQQQEEGLMRPGRRVLSHAQVACSFLIHSFKLYLNIYLLSPKYLLV